MDKLLPKWINEPWVSPRLRAWLGVRNTTANVTFRSFGFYADDNADVDSNTLLTAAVDDNLGSRGVGTANRFILRVALDQDNSANWNGGNVGLVYYKNGGATPITITATSTAVRATSALWNDTTETCDTKRLATGGQTFATGGLVDDTDGVLTGFLIAKNTQEEAAFCLYLVSGEVNDADYFDFELTYTGNPITNTSVPRVTASVAAAVQDSGSDGVKLSDSAAALVIARAADVDGMDVGDSSTVRLTAQAAALDGLDAGDTSTTQLTAQAVGSDGVKLGDSGDWSTSVQDTAADGLSAGDSATELATAAPIGADGLTATDSSTEVATARPPAGDGATVSDAATSAVVSAAQDNATDGLTASDASDSKLTAQAAGADGITASDTATAGAAAYADEAADGAKAGDSSSAKRIIQVSAADGIDLSDTAAVLFTAVELAAEIVKGGDAAAAAVQIIEAISDGVQLSDAATSDSLDRDPVEERIGVMPALTLEVEFV